MMKTDGVIPEALLQAWFVDVAQSGDFRSHITNLKEVEQRVKQFERAERPVDRVKSIGLGRALQLCRTLAEVEFLIADMSVADAEYTQLRPDLVLFNESAEYILVELKTKARAERQGIQELLAYSTAIKMQAPYVGDFGYIIVANDWTTILQFSTRALILEGKRVLPLKFAQTHGGKFQLQVLTELFNFDFSQKYDPWFALVGATIATALESFPLKNNNDVHRYFYPLAIRLREECKRRNQSGFVLQWRSYESGCTIASVTLFTLNQHWVHSEHKPSSYVVEDEASNRFKKLILAQATKVQSKSRSRGGKRISDFSAKMAGKKNFYPQSDLSYNLIEDCRRREEERKVRCSPEIPAQFESESVQNLEVFLDFVLKQRMHRLSVENVFLFGELKEYARTSPPQCNCDVSELISFLERFRDWKVAYEPMPILDSTAMIATFNPAK